MRKCLCSFCKFSRRAKLVMRNGSHQQKNRLITELMNNWVQESEDNSYRKCILDGSWPQAVEILERSLIKARQHSSKIEGS